MIRFLSWAGPPDWSSSPAVILDLDQLADWPDSSKAVTDFLGISPECTLKVELARGLATTAQAMFSPLSRWAPESEILAPCDLARPCSTEIDALGFTHPGP